MTLYSFNRKVIFTTNLRFILFYSFYIYLISMSVGWNIKWCPSTPLVRKRPFYWIQKKSRLVRAARARNTSKFSKLIINKTYVTAVIWLKNCRYGVKHYPINQSLISSPVRILYIVLFFRQALYFVDRIKFPYFKGWIVFKRRNGKRRRQF